MSEHHTLHDVVDTLKHRIHDAGHTISEVSHTAGHKISDAGHTATHKLSDMGHALSEATHKVSDNLLHQHLALCTVCHAELEAADVAQGCCSDKECCSSRAYTARCW